jgi:hypothetical protein
LYRWNGSQDKTADTALAWTHDESAFRPHAPEMTCEPRGFEFIPPIPARPPKRAGEGGIPEARIAEAQMTVRPFYPRTYGPTDLRTLGPRTAEVSLLKTSDVRVPTPPATGRGY